MKKCLSACIFYNHVVLFSMYPLLERDGQAIPYIATIAIFAVVSHLCFDLVEKKSKAVKFLVSRWSFLG